MNALNPALTIAGPAVLVWKDKAIYSQGDIPLVIKEETFDLPSSAYGVVAKAVRSTVIEVSATPLGTLNALTELIPDHIRRAIPGVLVHHAIDLGTINTGTGVITKVSHGYRDTAAVRVATFGELPAALDADTLYYLHVLSADTYTLHTTKAHAAAGTSPITPATAGTGRHRLIEQETLTIWSLTEGKGYVFQNAAVTKVPSLTVSSSKTVLGETTWTCYRTFGFDPATDTTAFYTEITAAPAGIDLSFDPDDIVTGAGTLAWGATAPWSVIQLDENGVVVDISLGLEAVLDQVAGTVSHRVTSVDASVKFRPQNVTEADVFAKRVLQGSGAGVGRRLSGDTATVTNDEFTLAVANAVLDGDSTVGFDGKESRVREMSLKATRHFTGGVIDPLFTLTLA